MLIILGMTTTTKKAPRTIRTADQVTLACHADYIAAKALDELLLAMGCAPTYEAACRAAEAAIYRRIANRMAVM